MFDRSRLVIFFGCFPVTATAKQQSTLSFLAAEYATRIESPRVGWFDSASAVLESAQV